MSNEKAYVLYSIKFPKELYKKVVNVSKKLRIPLASLIRVALINYIIELEKADILEKGRIWKENIEK